MSHALRKRLFADPQLHGTTKAHGAPYEPAYVQYLLVFSPLLTANLHAEDPAKLADQILYYTSMESAVPQAKLVRQVALANAFADFATWMHGQQYHTTDTGLRSLAIGSQHRRLVLVEVAQDMWMHACIALAAWKPYGEHRPAPWLEDCWAQEQLRAAWTAWRLANGDPDTIMEDKGRSALEQSLEQFLSKWVWRWDVEHQWAPALPAAPSAPRVGMVLETMPALSACTDCSAGRLSEAVGLFKQETVAMVAQGDMPHVMLLHDDELLYPQPHTVSTQCAQKEAQNRHDIVRYVLQHLLHMDEARACADAAREKQREESAPKAVRSELAEFAAGLLPGVSDMFSTHARWLTMDPILQPPEVMLERDGARAPSPSLDIEEDMRADGNLREALLDAPPDPCDVHATSAQFSESLHEPLNQFTTHAPFQAFHEQLSHALDMDQGPPEVPSVQQGVCALDAASQAARLADARRTLPKVPAAHATEEKAEKDASAAPWHMAPVQHVHHTGDPALDAEEAPEKWHEATLYVTGEHDALQPVHIVYTTRQLLTVVLVFSHNASRDAWLLPSWRLLQRVQDIVQDTQCAEAAPQYLHVDRASRTAQNNLALLQGGEHRTQASIESQLLDADRLMVSHGVKEVLARSNDSAFWVAARVSTDEAAHTFLVLQGNAQRSYGISECDQQMRRLASEHSEFNL
ncbi:hypothetical protein MVES1_002395 [Malassezia vespertilionis]|uniref:uncharacterized protein n=1 Tax=Malassezia vespertilionis TaxID=2020962 RepID=UPI0024B03C14|nr:uncharacterized protein MVES1_002395 [Malassezia vespertilionis]WFD07039.1 hypothetical protein MVES1_002395 [Malassezia vespertilionis]